MLTLHQFNHHHSRRCRQGCVRPIHVRIVIPWHPLRTAAAFVDARCRLSHDGVRCAVARDLGGAR